MHPSSTAEKTGQPLTQSEDWHSQLQTRKIAKFTYVSNDSVLLCSIWLREMYVVCRERFRVGLLVLVEERKLGDFE